MSLSPVYSDFANAFICEVSILIFYTVEIENRLRKYSKKILIFAKSVFNFNCIKYKNTDFANE